MLLVEDQENKVAEWAGLVLGKPIIQPAKIFGVVEDDGLLKGAAIFNDYQGPGGNIELTYVGPGTLTKNVMRQMAEFAFVACNASRVTLKTMRSNLVARKLLGNKKHGLVHECVLKRYYSTEKGGDALVFVLSRDHAKRWLGGSIE